MLIFVAVAIVVAVVNRRTMLGRDDAVTTILMPGALEDTSEAAPRTSRSRPETDSDLR